jgi:hypothetical protein
MDKTQRGWAIASLGILAASAIIYVVYDFNSPQGPIGGSTIGLTFGVIGFAFMIFAALLGVESAFQLGELGARRPGCAGIFG